MRTTSKALGVIGLVVVAMGTLVALNWEAVSKDLGQALDAQTERTQATLFRLGELMSISAALKTEYGAEVDMAYATGHGGRTLSITFGNYRLPNEVTALAHALDIAVFAIGTTTKFEQIDSVTVRFRTTTDKGAVETAGNSGAYSFALDELVTDRPQ